MDLDDVIFLLLLIPFLQQMQRLGFDLQDIKQLKVVVFNSAPDAITHKIFHLSLALTLMPIAKLD